MTLSDRFRLDDEVAVVIGAAAGGLGERAAQALSEQGATVAVVDLPSRQPEAIITTQRCVGPADAYSCDVTSEQSVDALFAEVMDKYGRIDVLVNAAGVMLRKDIYETSAEEFRHVLEVNLVGTWLTARSAARQMSRAGGGRIVNLSTVYAERVGPIPESAYYASKAGVANLTRSLAAELAASQVNVNCLAPAVFYPTEMTAPLGETPEKLEWFANRTMLGRLGDPETDLAGPLILLASRAGSYLTGQVVYVDGGWSAW